MGDTVQFVKSKATRASWKTSLTGLASILMGLGAVGKMIQDKDFNMEHAMAAFGLIAAGLTGVFARDNNKTSEDVGVTTKPEVIEQRQP